MTESRQFEIKGVSVTLENKNPQNNSKIFIIKCDNVEVLQEVIKTLEKRGRLPRKMTGETEMCVDDTSISAHDTRPFLTFERAAQVLSILERQSKEAGDNPSFALAERQRVVNPAWDLAEMALECLKDTDVTLTGAQKRKFREAFMKKCHSNVPGF